MLFLLWWAEFTGESHGCIWEVPGRFRFNRSDQPAKSLIQTPQAGVAAAATLTADDDSIVESLFDDSVETFLYGFQRPVAHRFLGRRFRTDDGSTPNYQGPWYDIYEAVTTDSNQGASRSRQKLYYFDSLTGLLAQTRYVSPGGSINITTEFNNWSMNAGQFVPGQVTRKENGVAFLNGPAVRLGRLTVEYPAFVCAVRAGADRRAHARQDVGGPAEGEMGGRVSGAWL